MLDVEGDAALLLEAFSRPPSAKALAEHHMGKGAIVRWPGRPGGPDAELVQIDGRPRVAIRSHLDRIALRWAVCHEVAEWHLLRLDYRERDIEAVAEALTAALVMPREDFRAAMRELGRRDLRALAHEFMVTQTAAALRVGEAGFSPVAVVAPTHVHVRSDDDWAWPAEPELRRLAKARRLPTDVARVTLTDDRRRRALLVG